jgi:AcrR family transcriptional regulator
MQVMSLYTLAGMIEMRQASFAPTTPKGHRTRARILDAARAVFARDGFVESRMGDIAIAARLSAGGLYRYFMSKEDVFAALVADLVRELYEASGHTIHSFAAHPYEALLEANRGYLSVYYENRDLLRAFVEAVAVDSRFREMWWSARRRHVSRFVRAAQAVHGKRKVNGVEIETVVESMACMVEQSAYLWWAQEGLLGHHVSVEDAAQVVTRAWYLSVYHGAGVVSAGATVS